MLKHVKLIVLLCTWIDFVCSANKYCEICPDHTLCEYTSTGPGPFCQGYDKSGKLSMKEKRQIVDRINARRNAIALGSMKLPQAANMRKVVWSTELARYAERWVDQCDPELRPEKEDRCRNLVDKNVTQIIATITGPSPGLQVTSFVDMWFMHILEYNGSVSYFNESQNGKTDYFTQLIWAESYIVGCAKARFYVEDKRSLIDRLICNFAPGGNIRGKPVFAIGFPVTQCSENFSPDITYEGLCRYNGDASRTTTKTALISSLLRIVNLSNNSAKNDIDPIKMDYRQILNGSNQNSEQRNQKIRHVLFNNTYGFTHNPFIVRNWHFDGNHSRSHPFHIHQQERGHSHVYHGHDHKNGPHSTNEYNGQNFRRFDFTTVAMGHEAMSTGTDNFRRHFQLSEQCTRRAPVVHSCATPCIPGCTRGKMRDICLPCQPPLPPPPPPPLPSPLPPPPCGPIIPNVNPCICGELCNMCNNPLSMCATTLAPCVYLQKYPCSFNRCQNSYRKQNDELQDESARKMDFPNYDHIPNMARRSGDISLKIDKSTSSNPEYLSMKRTSWPFSRKNIKLRTVSHPHHSRKVNLKLPFATKSFKRSDDSHGSFNYSDRKKRASQEQTSLKPFWQVDEFRVQKLPLLKSMRYTTLSNRQKRLRSTTVSMRTSTRTEPITIKVKYKSDDDHHQPQHSVTEKILSFDELMHLRKLTTEDKEKEVNARRQGGVTTTTSQGTVYTAVTGFVRIKQCTRKQTCTWTIATLTAPDGSVIENDNLANVGGGSKTPQGYVDGCTRTSTCTRDYMNRNKMASTISDEANLDFAATSMSTVSDDGDYCERRALNIRRRKSGPENELKNEQQNYEINNSPIETQHLQYKDANEEAVTIDKNDANCACNVSNFRKKRNEYCKHKINLQKNMLKHGDRNNKLRKTLMSYGDLYYVLLNKIIRKRESNKKCNACPCNKSSNFFGVNRLRFVSFSFLCYSVLIYL